MKQIEEPARRIPVRAEVDVLVVGAGPAGLMAAQAAALEKGTKVMLVESRGFLGGNMTIGLPLLGFLGRKGNVVIKGLPLQFVERLQEKGLATHHRACPLHVSLTMIDPEGTKHLAFQIIKECGIDLLMYAFATDVIMEGNTVKGVIIDSKKGREAILAKRVIDCTGDGDIAYRAGAPMNYGNEKGIPQPPTLMFSMRGVDSRKLRDAVADHPDVYDIDFIPNEFFRADDNCTFVGFRNQIKKAREAGYKLPVERTIFMTGMAPDEWWVNMSRVNGIDATDPAQYTQGEIICAEQNEEIVRYLKAYIPGFENAYVDRVAPFMGHPRNPSHRRGIHSDRGRHLQLRQVRRRHRRRKLSGGPSPSGGRRLLALLVSGLLRHPVPLSDTAENRRSHRRRTQRVDDASRIGFRPRHGSCNGSRRGCGQGCGTLRQGECRTARPRRPKTARVAQSGGRIFQRVAYVPQDSDNYRCAAVARRYRRSRRKG